MRTSYRIDAAYPDSLQPALLRVYRWVSGEWQRFTYRLILLSRFHLSFSATVESNSSSTRIRNVGSLLIHSRRKGQDMISGRAIDLETSGKLESGLENSAD